jgi:hypothetical protein
MTKEQIIELLEYKIDGVIGYIMEQENVTTGDCFPEQLMQYNRMIEQLADYVRTILDQNKPDQSAK